MDCEFLRLCSESLSESVRLFGGATFFYKGTSYPAVINDLEVSQVLIDGGLLQELITIIIVSQHILPAAPAIGETLIANGKLLRIKSNKADEVAYELHCITAAK
jgi:hypothetical protein